MRPAFLRGVVAAVALSWTAANAVETEAVKFEGVRMTVVRVDLREETLELFLDDEAGESLKSFNRLKTHVGAKRRSLVFAMNAGMYEPDFSPVGLHVERGREVAPLNQRQGWGNFYLKPNGVFLVGETGARIVESSRVPKLRGKATLATQSGPLLVIDGRIHPAFRAGSDSRLIRNGVGVVDRHHVVFALAEDPVNFHTFARFFRDALRCRNALFHDGTVSSLYLEEPLRSDRKIDLGPLIGVTRAR
jgi:uncharacterized protein YigE (DUF2233 family)